MLTIATDDPRKNLDALVPCAAALAQRGIELVWAGDSRPQFARTRPLTGLRALGYVPDELLVGLYRGAEAFVLPSRYEGFGLTCLEAMACGTPVVAADRAALPEVCGDAALLVDPDDPAAITQAVLAVCEDRLARGATARRRHRAGAALHAGSAPPPRATRCCEPSDPRRAAPGTAELSPGSARRPGTPPGLPRPTGQAAAG